MSIQKKRARNESSFCSARNRRGTVNAAPAQTLFDAVDEAGETQAVGRIDILDVVNDIACARVVMEGWHGMNFVDFHNLMKTEDGWKIVSKIYTQV